MPDPRGSRSLSPAGPSRSVEQLDVTLQHGDGLTRTDRATVQDPEHRSLGIDGDHLGQDVGVDLDDVGSQLADDPRG